MFRRSVARETPRPDSGVPDQPSGRESLPREIWVVVAGSFIVAIGLGIVSPALPGFAASFNVGIAAASMIVSAFAFMRLAFAPVSGRLVSRFGERRVHLTGLVIVGLSSGACAFAQSYPQLLVFRAFGGIGSTMFTVSAVALLVRLAPPHLRARASGAWATSFLIGNVSGPIVGGLLIGYSLRLPFLVYAVALFLAALVGWRMLNARALAVRTSDSGSGALSVAEAFRNPVYQAALVSNFSNGWAVFGVRVALIPLFMVQVLHTSQAMAGAALAVFALGNAVSLLPAGRFADRHGRKPMVIAGLAVSALGSVAFGFSATVPWFLVSSVVAGIGAGMLSPAQTAAVADVIGTRANGGPVLATFQMTSDIGAILGPIVAGILADALSYQAAFTATALTAAVALLFWTRAPEPGGSGRA